MSTRVGSGDVAALRYLVELHDELDEKINAAVRDLRSKEGGAYSWAQIAEATGLPRSTVARRFKHLEGARKPGGQPRDLR